MTVSAQQQCTGTAGRTENALVAVHLADAAPRAPYPPPSPALASQMSGRGPEVRHQLERPKSCSRHNRERQR